MFRPSNLKSRSRSNHAEQSVEQAKKAFDDIWRPRRRPPTFEGQAAGAQAAEANRWRPWRSPRRTSRPRRVRAEGRARQEHPGIDATADGLRRRKSRRRRHGKGARPDRPNASARQLDPNARGITEALTFGAEVRSGRRCPRIALCTEESRLEAHDDLDLEANEALPRKVARSTRISAGIPEGSTQRRRHRRFRSFRCKRCW